MAFNSTTPQIVLDTQNYTTSNCIAEIPQNIKFEQNGNIFTVKNGSKFVFYGNTYTTMTITNDGSLTLSATGQDNEWHCFVSGNNTSVTPYLIPTKFITSGDSEHFPTSDLTDDSLYYNVDDRTAYRYSTSTQQWTAHGSRYPFAIIQRKNNQLSIKCVFNGAGFIGHHIFVYPNTKALVPDGFNEDGSIKSTNVTTSQFTILEMRNPSYETEYSFPVAISYASTVARNAYRIINKFDDLIKQIGVIQYLKKSNICYIYDDVTDKFKEQNWTPFVAYNYDGTTVTQFDVKQLYEGSRNLLTDDCVKKDNPVNYTDLTTVASVATYTAPAGGVCYVYTSDTGTDTETFYINDVMVFNVKQIGTSGKTTTIPVTFILNKGDVLTCNHSWGSLTFIPFN